MSPGTRRQKLGAKYSVEYLPERPNEAEIQSAKPWIGGLLCVLFAAVFVALAVVFYWGMMES